MMKLRLLRCAAALSADGTMPAFSYLGDIWTGVAGW